MTETTQRVSAETLRQFVPINELTQDNLRDLAGKTVVRTLAPGRTLFKQGDKDNTSYYLLSGEIALRSDSGEKILAAGSAASRFPLDHHRPRHATAVSVNEIKYIAIDNDLLDILLTWDQNAGYMVTEIEQEQESAAQKLEDDNDWMVKILRSAIFHRIPPSNIQAIFMRMEAVPVKAGETVIRQGDDGDFYYYVSRGRCLVTRTSSKNGKELKLAELDSGSSFGEEALVSGTRRNANVIMLTDGVLMRLNKDDFNELLKEPVLRRVDYDTARQMVDEGAVWLDVRLESENKNKSIPGSEHIPLYLLRIKAGTLDKDKRYIVYCDTGRRSASAAYLLSERGLDAFLLDGGMMPIKDQLG